jgi:hypothetical protein
MAIDEHRSIFDVFRFHPAARVAERWFTGSHTDVGGGYRNRELADITLHWMAQKAVAHGLVVDPARINVETPVKLDAAPQIHNEDSKGWRLTNVVSKMEWTCQRTIGIRDFIDDTVLFISDHWKDLIRNDSLANNDNFKHRA